MARVYLSLGSNTDKHKNIHSCLDALAAMFGELIISSVYESHSVGFAGRNFFNLVVAIDSPYALAETSQRLKKIEDDHGRVRDGPKYSPRTLDIDILTFDNLVGQFDGIDLPRDEITFNAFVLQPLAEIAPEQLIPGGSQSYAQLWRDFDKQSQQLWPVEFCWQQRQLSKL